MADRIPTNMPVLTFKPVQIGEPYSTGKTKISFSTGNNKIKFSFLPSISLSYIEARTTLVNTAHEIGVGTLAASISGNIAANTYTDMIITASNKTFTAGDGEYLICIYGQSAVDGTWTEAYYFMVKNNQIMQVQAEDAGTDAFMVLRNTSIN